MKRPGWWLHVYLKGGNQLPDKLRGHSSALFLPATVARWPKSNLRTSPGCDYDVFMNLFQFHLLFVFTAVKGTFSGVSVVWKI